jgi:hypothetical protein
MNVTPESLEQPDSLLNQLAQTSDLADPMCSRSEWLLSYHAVFAPQRTLLLRASDSSLLALARVVHPLIGPLFEPLESHWFFPTHCSAPTRYTCWRPCWGSPSMSVHAHHLPSAVCNGARCNSNNSRGS